MILCPYCLEYHGNVCNNAGADGKDEKSIPPAYIKAVQNGALICPVAVMGDKGCGKTVYMSSIHHSLFQDGAIEWISDVRFLSDSKEQERQMKLLLTTLRSGKFPRMTVVYYESPLIVQLTFKKSSKSFLSKEWSVIFVIFDTIGGLAAGIAPIEEKFQPIKRIPNIIHLVDLHTMISQYDRNLVDQRLHQQANVIANSVVALEADLKTKNILLTFTKTDLFWVSHRDADSFKPLKYKPYILLSNKLQKIYIKKRSIMLEHMVKSQYPRYYSFIKRHFGGSCFLACSNIGTIPSENNESFNGFSPVGVLDPLLFLANY